MTYISHPMHLLAEQIVGAAATSVTFLNLHLDTGLAGDWDERLFRLYYEVRNPTASTSDYHIYFNGDTTNANYESQAMSAVGGATNFARTVPVAPRIIDGVIASPNGIFFGYTDIIFNSALQRVKYISMNSRGVGAAMGYVSYAGANTGVAIAPGTGITTVAIHSSVALAIDAGSVFRLFRISPI